MLGVERYDVTWEYDVDIRRLTWTVDVYVGRREGPSAGNERGARRADTY